MERNTGFEPATFALARHTGLNPNDSNPSQSFASALSPSGNGRAASKDRFQTSQLLPAFGESFSTRLLPGTRENLSALTASWLTVREAAVLLKVSTATIYKLCRTGTLPFTRVLHAIRISVAGLRAFTDPGRP